MHVYSQAGDPRGLSRRNNESVCRGMSTSTKTDSEGRMWSGHETNPTERNMRQSGSTITKGRVQMGNKKRVQVSSNRIYLNRNRYQLLNIRNILFYLTYIN